MNKVSRPLAVAAALLGLTGVIVGAATGHRVAGMEESIATAERYHQLYAAIILGLALSRLSCPPDLAKILTVAGWIFTSGTVLFCGGIYSADWLGLHPLIYAVPVGGTLLILGWTILLFAFLKRWG